MAEVLPGALALVVILYWLQTRRLKVQRAGEAYQAALAKLTAQPTDNALRIKALEAGRHYAMLARQAAGRRGTVVFDEIALNNDLSARAVVVSKVSKATEKECPDCAEHVKLDAKVCRFCRHTFAASA